MYISAVHDAKLYHAVPCSCCFYWFEMLKSAGCPLVPVVRAPISCSTQTKFIIQGFGPTL